MMLLSLNVSMWIFWLMIHFMADEGSASEVVTIGSTFDPTQGMPVTNIRADSLFLNNASPITDTAIVMDFTLYVQTNSTAFIQVWRPVFSNVSLSTHSLVYQLPLNVSSSQVPGLVRVTALDVSPCFQVKSGDLLGIYVTEEPNSAVFIYDFASGHSTRPLVDLTAAPSVGDQIHFDGFKLPITISLSARIYQGAKNTSTEELKCSLVPFLKELVDELDASTTTVPLTTAMPMTTTPTTLKGAKGDPGPMGPPGAAGPPGAEGDVGSAGSPGRAGAPGLRGDPGAAGSVGAQGDKGDRGLRGSDGVRGLPGNDGVRGEQGKRGLTGPKGDTGPPGPPGPIRYVPEINETVTLPPVTQHPNSGASSRDDSSSLLSEVMIIVLITWNTASSIVIISLILILILTRLRKDNITSSNRIIDKHVIYAPGSAGKPDSTMQLFRSVGGSYEGTVIKKQAGTYETSINWVHSTARPNTNTSDA